MKSNQENRVERLFVVKNMFSTILELDAGRYGDLLWHRRYYAAMCDAILDKLFCMLGAGEDCSKYRETWKAMAGLGMVWEADGDVADQLEVVSELLTDDLPDEWGFDEMDDFTDEVDAAACAMMSI